MQLYGSISMSDIKVILAETHGWRKLFQTCGSFFKDLRLNQSLEHDGKAILPVFAVSDQTSLIVVMVVLV
jgi:hypothetical protein